jgi:hypothetical protein
VQPKCIASEFLIAQTAGSCPDHQSNFWTHTIDPSNWQLASPWYTRTVHFCGGVRGNVHLSFKISTIIINMSNNPTRRIAVRTKWTIDLQVDRYPRLLDGATGIEPNLYYKESFQPRNTWPIWSCGLPPRCLPHPSSIGFSSTPNLCLRRPLSSL